MDGEVGPFSRIILFNKIWIYKKKKKKKKSAARTVL
jgi:hypothetical protein